MRFFQHLSFRIKIIIAVLASGLLVMVPSLVHAGLGSDRPTITYTGDATVGLDRKSTRLNSSHVLRSRMPSSA